MVFEIERLVVRFFRQKTRQRADWRQGAMLRRRARTLAYSNCVLPCPLGHFGQDMHDKLKRVVISVQLENAVAVVCQQVYLEA